MGGLIEPAASWVQAPPGAIVAAQAVYAVGNPAEHPAIAAAAERLEADLRARYAGQDRAAIMASSPFMAYAAYYKRFGQRYHVGLQVESVALKGKAVPRVAALVEAMFIAELDSGILTAGHDLGQLTLPVRVGVSDGAEPARKPNGDETTLKAGDLFTATNEGVLSAVITGPTDLARIGSATQDALFVVYAPAGIGEAAVTAHLDAIVALTRAIRGGPGEEERDLVIAGGG